MLTGTLLGLLLGMLLQRSQYCTMGALSDFFLFGSWRRLRTFGLALAIAVAGTQWLGTTDRLDLSQTRYLAAEIAPIGLLVGGLLFGWGMVLAGGCASRNLARVGAGSLKALTALLVMLLCSAAAATGAAGWLPTVLGLGLTTSLLPAGLPGWLAFTSLPLIGAILFYQFRRREFMDMATGAILGALVVAAWPLSILIEGQVEASPVSLDLVSRSNELLLWVAIDKMPSFTAALMIGTLIGAFSAAMVLNRFRLETFSRADDMLRHLAGGALMGVGGAVAMGGTFGQGLAGLATLSTGSILAVIGIVGGARLGLLQLELGGPAALFGQLSLRLRQQRVDK